MVFIAGNGELYSDNEDYYSDSSTEDDEFVNEFIAFNLDYFYEEEVYLVSLSKKKKK